MNLFEAGFLCSIMYSNFKRCFTVYVHFGRLSSDMCKCDLFGLFFLNKEVWGKTNRSQYKLGKKGRNNMCAGQRDRTLAREMKDNVQERGQRVKDKEKEEFGL